MAEKLKLRIGMTLVKDVILLWYRTPSLVAVKETSGLWLAKVDEGNSAASYDNILATRLE